MRFFSAEKQLILFGIKHTREYPFRAFIWTFQTVLWIFVMPYIWFAIYGEQEMLFEFSRMALVTYFVAVLVFEYMTVSYVDDAMMSFIYTGEYSNFLLRPYSAIRYLFFEQLGYRIPRIGIYVVAFAVLYFFFPDMVVFPSEWYTPLFLIVAIVCGHIISFNLKIMLGCIAFYIEYADSFQLIYWFFTHLFTGWIAPLIFFPNGFSHSAIGCHFNTRYIHRL